MKNESLNKLILESKTFQELCKEMFNPVDVINYSIDKYLKEYLKYDLLNKEFVYYLSRIDAVKEAHSDKLGDYDYYYLVREVLGYERCRFDEYLKKNNLNYNFIEFQYNLIEDHYNLDEKGTIKHTNFDALNKDVASYFINKRLKIKSLDEDRKVTFSFIEKQTEKNQDNLFKDIVLAVSFIDRKNVTYDNFNNDEVTVTYETSNSIKERDFYDLRFSEKYMIHELLPDLLNEFFEHIKKFGFKIKRSKDEENAKTIE